MALAPIGYDYDLIVLGSGPAGQRAALQAAKAGRKAAVVEVYSAVGGGCVHWGTLPSKSFRESVYRYSLGSRGNLGQEREHVAGDEAARAAKIKDLPEIQRLLRRRDRVVSGEAQVIFDQLKRNGIAILNGKAKVVGPHEIEVTGPKSVRKVSARFIFVATGARPVAPQHLAIDGKVVFDSGSILALKKMPKTMVVLGAGIIGCEFASMFSMAGTRVYLVDKRHEILASVDREIVTHLVEMFTHYNMEILLGCEAVEIDKGAEKGAKSRVKLSNGKTLNAEVVLVAQGRYGNTDGLGLDAIGVERDERGLVKVDANFRTKVPSVYAVGDVIGAPALASTSMEQGRIACCHAFQIGDSFTMPKFFPYGIYTIPEISMIGPSEEELVAKKADFVVGRARYRELARGQIVGDRWGILKMLVDRKTLKILGVHILGDNAADLIHIGQAVMAFGGDANYFVQSVFNYPTLAEAYKTAAFHAINQIKGVTKTR